MVAPAARRNSSSLAPAHLGGHLRDVAQGADADDGCGGRPHLVLQLLQRLVDGEREPSHLGVHGEGQRVRERVADEVVRRDVGAVARGHCLQEAIAVDRPARRAGEADDRRGCLRARGGEDAIHGERERVVHVPVQAQGQSEDGGGRPLESRPLGRWRGELVGEAHGRPQDEGVSQVDVGLEDVRHVSGPRVTGRRLRHLATHLVGDAAGPGNARKQRPEDKHQGQRPDEGLHLLGRQCRAGRHQRPTTLGPPRPAPQAHARTPRWRLAALTVVWRPAPPLGRAKPSSALQPERGQRSCGLSDGRRPTLAAPSSGPVLVATNAGSPARWPGTSSHGALALIQALRATSP